MSRRRIGKSTGTPEADVNAVTREATAFRLRCQGFDFPEIAEQCGYVSNGRPNASAAYKAWKRALARIPQQAIEEMRSQIFAQQMWAIQAMQPRIAKGDTFAIREMTAIHDRQAKLFGLDTPVSDGSALGAKVVVRAYPAAWVNALPAMTDGGSAPSPAVGEPLPEAAQVGGNEEDA